MQQKRGSKSNTECKNIHSVCARIKAVIAEFEVTSRISFSERKLKPIIIAPACTHSFGEQANPFSRSETRGPTTLNILGNIITVTQRPLTKIYWLRFLVNSNEVSKFNQQWATSSLLKRVTSLSRSRIIENPA